MFHVFFRQFSWCVSYQQQTSTMPNPGAVASQTGQCRMGVSRGRDEGGSHHWYRVDTSSRQVRWEVFMGVDYGSVKGGFHIHWRC
jgi:hypothetical protein